jgi:hypothetical protein
MSLAKIAKTAKAGKESENIYLCFCLGGLGERYFRFLELY